MQEGHSSAVGRACSMTVLDFKSDGVLQTPPALALAADAISLTVKVVWVWG